MFTEKEEDMSVSESNGFTKSEIERFDLIILFKQIERMLKRFYEPIDADNVYKAMVLAQDKIKISGINRIDDDAIAEHLSYCSRCGEKTFHHKLSIGKECSVCETVTRKKI